MKKVLFICVIMSLLCSFLIPASAETDNDAYTDLVKTCKDYLTYMQTFTEEFIKESAGTPSKVIDGIEYYKADERWQNYDNFRNLLLTVMTEEMADANLSYCAKNIDGDLYFRTIEGGFSDITYDITSDNLEIIHKTESTVRLKVKLKNVFVEGDEYEGEYIVLKNAKDGWRVAYYGIGTEPFNEWRYPTKIDPVFSNEYLMYRSEDIDPTLIPNAEIPDTADTDILPYYLTLISATVAITFIMIIQIKKGITVK